MADLQGLKLAPLKLALKRPKKKRTAPEAAEPESVLGKVKQVAGSGIKYVAETLDKPNRALWGSLSHLGGGPAGGGLLNLLPFSDATGLTDPEQGQSLSKVLEHHRILPQNKPGFDRWDPVRLGADIAGDPFSWATLGGGALTKGGRVAKAAGILGDARLIAGPAVGKRVSRLKTTLGDLMAPRLGETSADVAERLGHVTRAAEKMGVNHADVLNQPLGGLVGLGLPFGKTRVVLGTGAKAQKVAAAMDSIGRGVRFGKVPFSNFSPGSAVARLLHAPAGDASSRVGQEFLMPQIHAGRAAARAKGRGFVGEVTGELERTGGHLAGTTDQAASDLRKVYEGHEAAPGSFAPTAQKVEDKFSRELADADEWGIVLHPLKGFLGKYFPRHSSATATRGRTVQVVSAADKASIMRKPWLVGIPGETEQLRQVIRDPDVAAAIKAKAPTKDVADIIKNKFGHVVPPTFQAKIKKTGKLVIRDRYKAIASHIEKMEPGTRELGLFGNHPHADLLAHEVMSEQALSDAKKLLTNLADGRLLKEAAARGSKETVALGKVLEESKFHVSKALTKFAKLRGVAAPAKADLKLLSQLPIPKDLADDIVRHMTKVNGPEAANEIVAAIDSYTNLFKAGVTSLWPAFHVRNLFSGQFQNYLDDMWSKRSVGEAIRTVRGGKADVTDIPVIRDMLRQRGMANTPENATDVLRELAHKYEIVANYGNEPGSVVGRANQGAIGTTLRDVQQGFPGGFGGKTPYSFSDIPKKAIGKHAQTNLKPWDTRGFQGRTDTAFGPGAAGQDIGYFIETLNRLSPYIHELRKGASPAEAAKRVLAAQVDYGGKAYTAFERQVVHRAVPFAKFSKGIATHAAKTLAERPGGKMGQAFRAMAGGGSADATTPDYVADTASVPLGNGPEGSKRFLTGFGMMMEDPAGFLGGATPSAFAKGALMEGISRLNPLLKAPIEFASGQSFFQKGPMGGRAIDEMDPLVGRIIANVRGQKEPTRLPQSLEFALANSPVSRALSTIRTATDPRKRNWAGAMNLGTGVRISDISPAAQDAVLRERAAAAMKAAGAKSYAETYFSKEQLAEMTPAERKEALAYQALMKKLAENSKRRKAEKLSKKK